MSGLFSPRCRYCQGDVAQDDTVCPHCGEEIPQNEPPIGARTARAYKRGLDATSKDPQSPKSAEKKSGDGACFIATAAYGDPMAREVSLLRRWRDESLKGKKGGERFISLYYRMSPPLVPLISKSGTLSKIVRLGLRPIIHHLQHEN